jgi:hypothetical protein
MGLPLHFYDPATACSLVIRYSGGTSAGQLRGHLDDPRERQGRGTWFSTYSASLAPARHYTVEEITALLDGTELVPPGVVDARQWHAG